MLGASVTAQPARWDQISREAGIVSGYSRWMVGLRAWSENERDAAESERDPDRRERRLRSIADADSLLGAVEYLSQTLDARGRGDLGRVGRAAQDGRRPVARP